MSYFLPPLIPKDLNLEGLSSAIRIAMIPYAPNALKISLNKNALVLEEETSISGLTRKLSNSSHVQIIVVKRIVRIMLNLFPLEQEIEDKDPLTQVYQKVIAGLKYFDKKRFASIITDSCKIDDSDLKSFDYDHERDSPPSEKMAAEAIRKAISVLEYSLNHRVDLAYKLSPLQTKVKDSYSNKVLSHFVNSLDLLEEHAKDPSVSEHYYKAVYSLTEASLEKYRCFKDELGTLLTDRKNEPSPPADLS